MTLTPIHTGNFKLDGGAMFGVVPKTLWQKTYPADENNLCNWAMRCLLVEFEDRKILIDTGIGEKQDAKFLSHFHLNGPNSLEKSLAEAGVSPNQITDVLHTHLHFDHCGGSIRWNNDKSGFALSFPNATYWAGRQHWEWALNTNLRERPSFLKENLYPMQESGRLRLIENEGFLYPNIELRIMNGHTRGQIIPLIRLAGKTLVFMADFLPSVAHVPLPYIMSYDIDPLQTLREKQDFYKEAIENNYVLFLEHDINHECCTIRESTKGYEVLNTFHLNEFSGNH
ncbi:MAG: MBL fold metallo-hydrolase [Bacteroidales bacterium]|nr:MBL fold metallo-hydrolase [Bacteroidales bacterium]